MAKRLVIAGGGHAHMLTLARLRAFVDKGCEVTVIGPSEFHYYSGMGPGMLGGTYRPEEIRFATRRLTEKMGGRFKRGRVASIDADKQLVVLESGETLPYDVLSCNLGSQVPSVENGTETDNVFSVKPIERLAAAQSRITDLATRQDIRVGVIGGGPSAVEIAGNIWRLGRLPGTKRIDITILAGSALMPHHPPGVRRRAEASLLKRGITIVEKSRAELIGSGLVVDQHGVRFDFDVVFVAVGVKPSKVFSRSGIPTGADGGMLVNRYLQSTAYPNIFGGGDCISFQDRPLDKVGVYAVRQNPVLFDNLMATLTGGELKPFQPGGAYLLIFNLGDGTGILCKWSILLGGRLAFIIKDYIDRRFMRAFQSFE